MYFYNYEDKIEFFMFAYMKELEDELLIRKHELMKIDFQLDEANTDKPLKIYLKRLIEKQVPCLRKMLGKRLIINKDGEEICIDCNIFSNIIINKVYLPDELTKEMKYEIAEKKRSVYTNPDLYLQLIEGDKKQFVSIELKSQKSNSIPGSSVQQIEPNEWVIFIRHVNNKVDIETGQYINILNSKLKFPDRSPRPDVGFSELSKWNENNRQITENEIRYSINSREQALKYEMIDDWQSYLSSRWIEVLFSQKIKKKEPWFNNTMRKFIIDFLERYEALTLEEKEEFKQIINGFIQ